MTKNQVQTERMLSYFLEAAKNIIKSEGIAALSVRSIAEKAGYSYATLYNYYKDVRELTLMSAMDFIGECREYVLNNKNSANTTKELIVAKSVKFAEFFVQYSGIYQLLYVTPAYETGNVDELSKQLLQMHKSIFGENFNELFGNESENMISMHNNLLTGILLNYNNRRNPDNYKEFKENLLSQLNKLLIH